MLQSKSSRVSLGSVRPTTGGRRGAVADPPGKRALDILLTSIGLILSSPFWLAVAIAIKLDDGGPIFYYQERWGRNGRRFRIRKFRTMIVDSDRLHGIQPAAKGDARVTRVGRITRGMGLDELPQLIQIWRGDMSLVGPRALAIGEIVDDGHGRPVRYEDVPGFWQRLAARPGLTGIATIYIPKDSPPRRQFHYDLLYIRRQSLWLDLRLIALSLWISVSGRWETRERKY
jgi:lipopolysaccharide/colanic/teichoic acid biosynthesis glycosyltransferase